MSSNASQKLRQGILMKTAVLRQPQQLVIEETEIPEPGDDELLIKVKAVGICGSDIHAFEGLHPRRQPPVVLGHELSGEVMRVGANVETHKAGSRVTVMPQHTCGECEACRRGWTNLCDTKQLLGSSSWPGGFAEYVIVPAQLAYQLPGELSFIHGALVEPLAVAVHAVGQAQISLGDRVAVLGVGSIGMFCAISALKAGATEIISADLRDHNLVQAEKLGATYSVNTDREELVSAVESQWGPNAVDVAFVAAGSPGLIDQAIQIVRKGGKIVLLAILDDPVSLSIEKSRLKEQHIVASSTYVHDDYVKAIALLRHTPESIESVVTHRVSFPQIESTLRLVQQQREGVIKAIIEFDD